MSDATSLFEEISKAGLILDNNWKIRQNDDLDAKTKYIYSCSSIKELLFFASKNNLSKIENNYAIHRWRNFKRHEAWLSLLVEELPNIVIPSDKFNKLQDFFIRSGDELIPFDLKITRYPQTATSGLSDRNLADWFYQNQSTQGRFHLSNRFFIVGEPEELIYEESIARRNIQIFRSNMSAFRHFITHSDGTTSRAVVIRQRNL